MHGGVLYSAIVLAVVTNVTTCLAQARERVTFREAGRSLRCEDAATKVAITAHGGGEPTDVKFGYKLNRINHSSLWFVDFATTDNAAYEFFLFDKTCTLVPGTLKFLGR
jgi:hypothetical protein